MEKGGKSVAADVADEGWVEFVPAAMDAEMDGLPVMMKLPHIAVVVLVWSEIWGFFAGRFLRGEGMMD